MLKETLTSFSFVLVVVCSVRGDDGFPESRSSFENFVDLIPGYKENCSENPIFCHDMDTPSEYQSDSRTHGKDLGKEEKFREILFENPLHKRFLVARRKNPTARGYKRGPGFRSWGGKRDSNPSRQDLDTKVKFGPWGGKRDEEFAPEETGAEEKRGRFQNWGGKRGEEGSAGKRGSIWKERRFYFGEPLKKDVPKRPQFQSWGGKRTPWFKQFAFSDLHYPRYSFGGEKRKFSSWGGKRDEYDTIKHWDPEDNASLVGKILKNAWESDKPDTWKGEDENETR